MKKNEKKRGGGVPQSQIGNPPFSSHPLCLDPAPRSDPPPPRAVHVSQPRRLKTDFPQEPSSLLLVATGTLAAIDSGGIASLLYIYLNYLPDLLHSQVTQQVLRDPHR